MAVGSTNVRSPPAKDRMTAFQVVVVLVQVSTTMAMVGLIWFVQIVHYPLFSQVGVERFSDYERMHRRVTSYVVAPIMLAELLSSILLLLDRPHSISLPATTLGLLLLVVIWGSTFLIQVPLHTRLNETYDPIAHRRLVGSNWLRTVGWTLRGILVLWMVAGLIPTAS